MPFELPWYNEMLCEEIYNSPKPQQSVQETVDLNSLKCYVFVVMTSKT